jgi:hypothetical protein
MGLSLRRTHSDGNLPYNITSWKLPSVIRKSYASPNFQEGYVVPQLKAWQLGCHIPKVYL